MQIRLHRDVSLQDLTVSACWRCGHIGCRKLREPDIHAPGSGNFSPTAWSRVFPGRPDQVRHARQYLAKVLEGCPAADDAVLCLSELASNAVVHSRSRQPGGTFTVRARVHGQWLRVEVCDQGGSWDSPGRAGADEQHGRGLLIVGQLAARWGCDGHSQYGWTVWFELDTCP